MDGFLRRVRRLGVEGAVDRGIITWPVDGGRTSLQQRVYEGAFHAWHDARKASLLYAIAIAIVVFWYLVLLVLHRRGIVVKV